MIAAPQAMASKFPAIVHVYTDVLRVLANAPAPMTATQLAAATRRDKSNVRRDLKKLEEAGVLTLDSEGAFVTDEGVAWVRGQAVAEGLESAGPRSDADAAPPPRAGHANFRPNPDQPRKDFDEAVIRGIADTIAADAENGGGGLLQALLVRPRDPADPLDGEEANPVRMIWAGEQRWRAIGLLIAEDRLPAVLDPARGGGIPYDERAEPPGGASFLALVENGARSGLDPLDEAFAFLDYVTREDLSARQAAIRTGRAAEGEGGVRTVQIRIKVAREATAEAIAEYRRTRDWNALVDSVQKSQAADLRAYDPIRSTPEEHRAWCIAKNRAALPDLSPKALLVLVELADKIIRDPAADQHGYTETGETYPDHTKTLQKLIETVGCGGSHFGGRSFYKIGEGVADWLIEQGYLQAEGAPADVLHRLRVAGAGAAPADRAAATGQYWTPWLNRPAQQGVAPEEPGLFDPPPAAPARTLAEILPGRSVITLAEIIYLSPEHGRGAALPQAQAAKYWLDQNLSVMKDAGLITIVHEPAQPPLIRITDAGLDAFHAAVTERTGGELDRTEGVDQAALDFVRVAWGQAAWPGPGMVTEWLNIEPPAAPPAEAAEAAQAIVHTAARDVGPGRDEDGAPSHEDLDDDEAREAAGRVRVEVDRAMVSLPVMGFARLMAAAGLGGALRTRPDMPGVVFDASGEDILCIDQHNQLPDDLVHARATLVSAALNAANGAGVPLTLGDLVPDDDQSPAARLERALRRVSDWMAWHYEPLIAVPDAEAVYGQVSEALNAARAARRTEA